MVAVEIDRRQELGGVRDQGTTSTCLSHATSVVHRFARNLDEPLSAETLHYHVTGGDWSRGITIDQLRKALEHEGQPKMQDCNPFKHGRRSGWAPPVGVPVYCSRADETDGLRHIAISALRDNKLPVLGLSIPMTFHTAGPSQVLSGGGPIVGRHAVAGIGVGSHNGEEILLIRNSWGEDWADGGHAWLDTSFLDEHLEVVLVLPGVANQ